MERKSFLRIAAASALVGIGPAPDPSRNRYHQAPPGPHFDGERFFLPDGAPLKRPSDLLRWKLGGDRVRWPREFPGPRSDRPPIRVGSGTLRISFVGHASFLIQTAGRNLLFDPVWSERASPVSFAGPRRVNRPGIGFEDLPPIDWVLVSHNHYDHLDLDTLRALEGRSRPTFVTPLGNGAILRAGGIRGPVRSMDWDQAIDLGEGFRVHLLPSRHWSARGFRDRNHALWGAFLLETPAGLLYLVGDTGFGDGALFEEVGRRFPGIRVAILPIGAYEPRWFMADQHVDPEEAVRILEACGAETAIAHHWGTFQLTDEAIEAPPEALASALFRRGIPSQRFLVPRPGEVIER